MEDLFGGICGLLYLVVIVVMIASMWKVFEKAGQPGWTAVIPILNYVVMLKIVGRPLWWVVLLIIPLVNLVVAVIVCIDLAKSFGHGAGYGVGLALLPFVFFPMLGFGDDQYQYEADPIF